MGVGGRVGGGVVGEGGELVDETNEDEPEDEGGADKVYCESC